MIAFVVVYLIFPSLFVGGLCLGMKIQLKQDAEQSLLPLPCDEWRIAVFKAKMASEERK